MASYFLILRQEHLLKVLKYVMAWIVFNFRVYINKICYIMRDSSMSQSMSCFNSRSLTMISFIMILVMRIWLFVRFFCIVLTVSLRKTWMFQSTELIDRSFNLFSELQLELKELATIFFFLSRSWQQKKSKSHVKVKEEEE